MNLPALLLTALAGWMTWSCSGPWAFSPVQPSEAEQARRRQEMVQRQLADRDITSQKVLRAMGEVPRHEFVPPEMRSQAYRDSPLPIGYGQTISQPYIVALMTQYLDVKKGDKVLEIGTGSGYQAAVLAQLDAQVFTIEIVSELAERAREILQRLGYDNVQVRAGDGYAGWPGQAPFEAIIVTAAPEELPQPLADQLAEGGRMIIPVGPTYGVQSLLLYRKEGGRLKKTDLGPVRFVPFTRNPDSDSSDPR
ncbi:MAG TPA: protein-L-isoaspartate(D-aspartate) O-methyltransferase [Acidobacteriota bacterium]|nr:protein-L-isoaspartate(D-aspartate) O-methyltransferase [Acidobacteriota bacterium]